VEQLRTSVLAAKSFVALAVGDFVLGGRYAEELLAKRNLPGGYRLLGNLYAAESCILQDKISEAIHYLDPANVADDIGFGFTVGGTGALGSSEIGSATTQTTVAESRTVLQYNLAVSFALREEWDKAASLVGQLYERSREVSMHVLLLNLYVSLRQGRTERARQLVRERCPTIRLEVEP
jgi:CCR4-NOT transcription complex subunit 10